MSKEPHLQVRRLLIIIARWKTPGLRPTRVEGPVFVSRERAIAYQQSLWRIHTLARMVQEHRAGLLPPMANAVALLLAKIARYHEDMTGVMERFCEEETESGHPLSTSAHSWIRSTSDADVPCIYPEILLEIDELAERLREEVVEDCRRFADLLHAFGPPGVPPGSRLAEMPAAVLLPSGHADRQATGEALMPEGGDGPDPVGYVVSAIVLPSKQLQGSERDPEPEGPRPPNLFSYGGLPAARVERKPWRILKILWPDNTISLQEIRQAVWARDAADASDKAVERAVEKANRVLQNFNVGRSVSLKDDYLTLS